MKEQGSPGCNVNARAKIMKQSLRYAVGMSFWHPDPQIKLEIFDWTGAFSSQEHQLCLRRNKFNSSLDDSVFNLGPCVFPKHWRAGSVKKGEEW